MAAPTPTTVSRMARVRGSKCGAHLIWIRWWWWRRGSMLGEARTSSRREAGPVLMLKSLLRMSTVRKVVVWVPCLARMMTILTMA